MVRAPSTDPASTPACPPMPLFPARRRAAQLLTSGGGILAAAAVALACRAGASESAAATAGAARSAGATGMPADSVAQRAAADTGRIQGSPSARVWLVEVSDFQCPYCKMWHDESYEAIHRDYIAAGKVRAAYLNFPLDMHVQAMPSAEAAMCASAQGKFWPYHSALFRSQQAWGKPGDQSAYFDSLATSVGADVGRFRACTRSHVMRALIEADQDRMERRGVRSTPTFYVGNKQIAGAQPLPVFREALDAAVASPPSIPGR